jgi:alanine racemase
VIRCTTAHVHLDAVRHNLRALQAMLAADVALNRSAGSGPVTVPDIIAVVKANAYGHGAVAVARALEDAGAQMLAVADIEEGIELRESGITMPILVFGALSVSDVDGLFTHRLTPTISSPGAGRALEQAARARGTTLPYHLKIDTGLNRLGFRHDNLRQTLPALLASPALSLEAVYTHFASADDPDASSVDAQRQAFDTAYAELVACGARSVRRHAANSAALLRDSRLWFDAVRPGLLLYGMAPGALHTAMDLRPAITLTSRVVAVKGVRTGEAVGYGGRFLAQRPTTLAIVPAGYADGLDRRLEGRGAVLIRGRRAPIVGAVSMDMLTADITDIAGVSPGDEVVLLGAQGDASWQRIDAREMAAAIGTIPYEIVCRLGSRIARLTETASDDETID